MAELLVVDDDRRLRDLLKSYLTEQGFVVHSAASAAEARSALAIHPINLIVLDVMMPGEDGMSLARSLRDNGVNEIAILLLTARDTLDDKIEGFETGVDDYLTKPFEPAELVARIRALLRRSLNLKKSVVDQESMISLGAYQFDVKTGVLICEGSPVFLTSSELILLKILAQSPRKPFSREDLAQRIGHRVSERSVDVQIVRLRRKIGDDSRQPRYLQTVRHIGYGLYPDEG